MGISRPIETATCPRLVNPMYNFGMRDMKCSEVDKSFDPVSSSPGKKPRRESDGINVELNPFI